MMSSAIETPQWLQDRLFKPAAIFGAGKSGLAAHALLRKLGCDAEVFDEQNDAFRRFDPARADDYGLVVFSPAFTPEHPWLQAASAGACLALPEFDLGAALWQGPVIAVTGTNGKTTLTDFLSKAFSISGSEAYAVGNIGKPLSSLLAEGCNPEGIAVCEVSSFQAEQIEYLKPDYVLWTNFDEDHLDRHLHIEAYFASKYRLVEKAELENVFYGRSVKAFAKELGRELPAFGYVEEDLDADELGVRGTVFENMPEMKNYQMARALWLRMGLSEETLIEAANSFEKAPHRMELARAVEGVQFWDDSKATNFHATVGGLGRFKEKVVWIGGGKSKGGDLETFAQRLSSHIKQAFLIGETASKMATALQATHCSASVCDALEDAVDAAFAIAEPGDNVVLSPGFASFDMFDGYSHRGEQFKKAVNALQK